MFCKDCGQPMRIFEQGGVRPSVQADCKNPKCDLYDVTLDVRTWQTITGEQLEAYRQMVRKTRAGAA